MPHVGYVEFYVPDHEETAAFYEAVFGWKLNEMYSGYLNVESGDEPGIDTGIARSEDGSVSTVATLLVGDLDGAVAKVEEHGGTLTVPPFPIPGVGFGCYFTDINGMTVGMWQADASAGVKARAEAGGSIRDAPAGGHRRLSTVAWECI